MLTIDVCTDVNDFPNHYVEGKKQGTKDYKLCEFICKDSTKYKLICRGREEMSSAWGQGIEGKSRPSRVRGESMSWSKMVEE